MTNYKDYLENGYSYDEYWAFFENLVNDFPQKIRYLKTSRDSLQVIISGIIPQGEERTVTFKMRSVSF